MFATQNQMMIYRSIIVAALLIFCSVGHLQSQSNTIGLLEYDESLVSDGYILLNPEDQSTVFLINNCGEVVHTWETDEVRFPGKEQYISPDGKLYLASIQPAIQESSFGAGGAGGVLEIIDWEGNVEWQYVVADQNHRQHHDIHIMPNGNIMFIAWENIDLDEAAFYGFDTLNHPQLAFWPDKIVEVDPSTDEIVWQWRAIDHMVQDIDSSRINFGIVSEHPERININYVDFAFGRQDVHHINSLDYNEELDMVMVSVRNFNEIWIIDHSTTIEEAASTSGGLRNHGGDLLYRWGNPAAYNAGDAEDQMLFRQHDATWIDDVPADHPYYGQVSVYNNFIAPELSLGAVLNPIFDPVQNAFETVEGIFLPLEFTTTKSHPMQEKNFSTAASNIQFLENGNVLFCAARQGRVFEITSDGALAWEYLVPMRNGFSIPQGQTISLSENFTFSGRRYAPDYSAFEDKDLSPKGYIEFDPNEEFCDISLSLTDYQKVDFAVFPNPTRGNLMLESEVGRNYEIRDVFGNLISSHKAISPHTNIDLARVAPGLYFVIDQDTKQVLQVVRL